LRPFRFLTANPGKPWSDSRAGATENWADWKLAALLRANLHAGVPEGGSLPIWEGARCAELIPLSPLKLDFAAQKKGAWPSRPFGDWSAFSHPAHLTAAHRRDALCPSP